MIYGTLSTLFLEKIHLLAKAIYERELENAIGNDVRNNIYTNSINDNQQLGYVSTALDHVEKNLISAKVLAQVKWFLPQEYHK